jgi:hypothetical protein
MPFLNRKRKNQISLFPEKKNEIVDFYYIDLSANRRINLKANTIINFWPKSLNFMKYRKLDGYYMKNSEKLNLSAIRHQQKNNPVRKRERAW